MPYAVRFVYDSRVGARWDEVKRMLADNQKPFIDEVLSRLGDIQWIEARQVADDVLPELELVEHDSGIGETGPKIRIDDNTCFLVPMPRYRDILFNFYGDGWTPARIYPYRLALEEVLLWFVHEPRPTTLEGAMRARVSFNLDVRLEVTGGAW